jgi:hypothetical protein
MVEAEHNPFSCALQLFGEMPVKGEEGYGNSHVAIFQHLSSSIVFNKIQHFYVLIAIIPMSFQIWYDTSFRQGSQSILFLGPLHPWAFIECCKNCYK